MQLKDKVAVVTGAASGFGKGIAEKFVAEGAKVAVADLNADAGQAVVDALGGDSAVFVRCDVSKDADVAALVRAAVERFGRLDVMVNNAGITHRNGPMLDVPEEEFDRIYAVNVKSIYLSARHSLPVFRGQGGGGVILNVASTAGVRPRPGLTWYNGSKGAVITLTRSMAVELAAEKIRVNALNPVMGETGLTDAFLGDNSREKIVSTIPIGRMSTPRDIANAAAFLASDDADFLTGVCLDVDGGRCI